MNKYLEKVAEFMSDENKRVAKTFAIQSVASQPAHILGGAVGAALGKKYLKGVTKGLNRAVGRTAYGASRLGNAGRVVSKYVRKAKVGPGALGIVLGMNVIGGVSDLAALKHGFHQEGKTK